MRIATSSAPRAGLGSILRAFPRRSASQKASAPTAAQPALAPEAVQRASEERWMGRAHPLSSVVTWVLSHRRLALGLAMAMLVGTAALLPAIGIAPEAQLAQQGFPAFGITASPGSLAAVQLPSSRPRRSASRDPLSLIAPSTLPSESPTPTNMFVGLDIPAGVTPTLPGQASEGQQSFRSLLLAFALAVFLVYLVTASQLESLLNPVSILFTVPMGLIAAAWGLYATGATLNAVALIGTILLAGILVNNAIVLIDAIKYARARGIRTRAAMIEASRSRVRPIMITSIGTVLGLLPMAVGASESLGIRRPMTLTVIAGLAVATFLVAVAAPVLYTLFEPRSKKTV